MKVHTQYEYAREQCNLRFVKKKLDVKKLKKTMLCKLSPLIRDTRTVFSAEYFVVF